MSEVGEVLEVLLEGARAGAVFLGECSECPQIDPLINLGNALRQVEIKSGATYRKDFFKQLDWFTGIADVPLRQPTAIYGGTEYQQHTTGELLSWKETARLALP